MGATLTTMGRLGFPDWTCVALSGLAIAVSHGAQGSAVGQAPRSTLGLHMYPFQGQQANNSCSSETTHPPTGAEILDLSNGPFLDPGFHRRLTRLFRIRTGPCDGEPTQAYSTGRRGGQPNAM